MKLSIEFDDLTRESDRDAFMDTFAVAVTASVVIYGDCNTVGDGDIPYFVLCNLEPPAKLTRFPFYVDSPMRVRMEAHYKEESGADKVHKWEFDMVPGLLYTGGQSNPLMGDFPMESERVQ